MMEAFADHVPEYVANYWRLWWSRARAELAGMSVTLAMAGAGLAGGLWLARALAFAGPVATGITLTCVAGAMVADGAVRRIRRRPAGQRAGREWPHLIRLPVRGETAVVVLPYHGGDSVAVWMGAVAGALAAESLNMLDYALSVAAVAGPLAGVVVVSLGRTAMWLSRPRLALFADRIEIRRRFGRHVIPWSAVASAGDVANYPVVYVQEPDLVRRTGIVRRPSASGVRVGAFALPTREIVGTIERYRRDAAARRAISSYVPPKVVDDGTRWG